jgi:hypothetical protein
MDSSMVLLSCLIAGFAIIALITIPAFALAFRNRAMAHAECMKALELGRETPEDRAAARTKAIMKAVSPSEDVSLGGLAHKCYSTAVWVAFWGFGSIAGIGKGFSPTVAIAIAASVGAVGVTAVICGTILGARGSTAPSPVHTEKFPTEVDAYDIAR